MKKIVLSISAIFVVTMFSSAILAQNPGAGMGWRAVYQDMLEKGKGIGVTEIGADGLPYTPPEGVVLEEAITYALSEEKGDRACECMIMAVELDYNPYSVLKTIYGVGGDLEIDQLCSCATESGVTRAIIAQAATDAVNPLNGEPVYDAGEISRSQCLTGLAYPEGEPPPPPVSPVVP